MRRGYDLIRRKDPRRIAYKKEYDRQRQQSPKRKEYERQRSQDLKRIEWKKQYMKQYNKRGYVKSRRAFLRKNRRAKKKAIPPYA
jgi:hypothetical protein